MSALLSTLTALALAAEPAPPPTPDEVTPPRLLAPLDLPRVLPARRDVPVVVFVQLTVQADGTVEDLALADPPGAPRTDPAIAKIALDALAAARISPATRGGEPLAVRITVPVTLGQPTASLELRYDRRDPAPTPTVARGVEGRVLERGTRRPVAGVAVLLDGERETLTDEDGRFAFRDVAAGTARVEIPLVSGQGAAAEVRVPGSVTLRIDPDALADFRTRVLRGPTVTDAARIRVPVERAREVPGSSGDPLKVLESLPGVARPAAAGPGAGELAVRGTAPEDTKLFIDGLPLFQLYHFGNIYSVVQDAWIDDIDFRAGGFSTGFGDAIGGIVDVTLKDLDPTGVHGHLDVNVYHAAGLVTVPLSEDWTLGVALRRSWVDAILGGIVGDSVSFSTVPRYYDYQVRADYRPRDDGPRLRLLVFGSDDEVVVLGGGPDADDPNGSGFSLRRFFHQIQGRLLTPLAPGLDLSLGLATSYQGLELSPGQSDFALTFDPITLRADLAWRGDERLRLEGGLWAELTRFKVELALPLPTKEGQVQLPSEIRPIYEAVDEGLTGRLDLWGEASYRALDALTLSGGFRLASWHGGLSAVAPDLRLAASWQLAEPTRLTLSGGLTHPAPAPDETARTTGNPDLDPERGAYVNLAFAHSFGDLFALELQGFYKRLDQLVSPTADGAERPYDNAGTGAVIGGELLLRLQHPVVDGWVAYTLSRSRRTDRPGEPERFFSFDQTHVLALVAGVKLGRGWRFGTRLRYATGNPFTPLEPAYFDAGADVWVPRAAGAPLSQRSADFLQLDLRVDKTWVFDTWSLELYFELNNATNRRNIESIQYAEDYRSRDDITSFPLTPSLGVRGAF